MAGIRRELRRLCAIDAAQFRGFEREEFEDAQAGIVRVRVRVWLRCEPTVAERKAVSRALEALERRGIIERMNAYSEHGRTTHVCLLDWPREQEAKSQARGVVAEILGAVLIRVSIEWIEPAATSGPSSSRSFPNCIQYGIRTARSRRC